MASPSDSLLNQFLAGGTAVYPMAAVYEDQYLNAVLSGEVKDSKLTIMYPTPDVSVGDTLVAWTPAGEKLIDALRSQQMAPLLESDGYRTTEDAGKFANYMKNKGLTVLNLDDPDYGKEGKGICFLNSPAQSVLQELIDAVEPSHSVSLDHPGVGRVWLLINAGKLSVWPVCQAVSGCVPVDYYRFRRHHIKWHYRLRGENRKWARRARSTPRNTRTKQLSWW